MQIYKNTNKREKRGKKRKKGDIFETLFVNNLSYILYNKERKTVYVTIINNRQ